MTNEIIAGAAQAVALVAPQAEVTTAIGIASPEKSEDEADAPSAEELRALRLAAFGQNKGKEEERK